MRLELRYKIICIILLATALQAIAQNTFTLEEAISYALENSNSIEAKNIEIADAIQNVKELKAIGLPKVSGRVDYQYYIKTPSQPLEDFITPSVIAVLNNTISAQDPIPVFQSEPIEFSFFLRNNLNANIDASMIVFDGSYLAALEAAKLFKDFSKEGIEVTKQEIRATVTKAYLNVLILEKNKETIQKNIKNLEKSIFEIGEMYKSGFLEKLDVDRLDVSFLNLKTEYAKLLQVEKLSKNVLKFQMDYPLEDEIILTENLDEALDRYLVEEVSEETELDYSKKAEYLQILMGLELNAINVKRLQKGYYPTLSVFANLSETLQREKLFNNDEVGFLPAVSVGLSLNVPIYDGGEKSAQIQRAKLTLEKRNLDLENFEKVTALQVYNSKLQYLNARSTVETTKRSLELMEDIHEKTLIKFREGVGSSIEVTQAESNLYQAQSSYINALYDLLNAKTDLDIALGEI